ncbi:MAG: DNA translocase FtsK, partial [Lachnospiraceae bacterium]|nr:DNA translocase FtsK [Lachnospiraceae bacterium]
MPNYYDTNQQTSANGVDLMPGSGAEQHFPSEGLYIGSLSGGSIDVPALVDLRETPALCFLYNDEDTRVLAGCCIERLVWRLALTVPSQLCDLLLFNGGNPGDWFNAHLRINRFLFDSRQEKVFFDSSADVFKTYLDDIYTSIVERMSTIRLAGKKDLVELNESLQNDARLKYRFIIMTDFPRHLKVDVANRLKQIIEAGRRAGIYVIMSWDMRADFEDASHAGASFDHKQMLSLMELLVPSGGEFRFQNSGHDEVFNRFNFAIDGSPINPVDIEQYLQFIDIGVETAKKMMAPTVLKQDFKSLEATPYGPVMSEICVTVGKDVHDKHPVTFKLNSGDYIHGFILGQSGSGKSVLLNNIITSAVLKYSPEDLMLYLMDFKGVEFNRYRGLKHTKAVLVDNSDPQMTLEVLRELKEEYNKRRKLFARNSCSIIDAYNRKHLDERLPQIIFVADECQVMFKEPVGDSSRAIFKEITEILNTIATQGRSYGIHMLLATQQLGETDISGEILKNLTECFLLMSAPSDSEKLVPDSSDLTSRQITGIGCYYHKLGLESQVQTFYATDEELESALEAAQEKTGDLPSNGGHYFCGSSKFYLDDYLNLLDTAEPDEISALVGQNIGINAGTTTVPIKQDFYENILFWGGNKEEQTTGVVMNALVSLICSSRKQGLGYRFLVIDCLPKSSG